ncbi:MAG TPA: HEAT repeat domain-containing protein, partial [bacterium]|nr:HEAT repeat domain-containing protein [bacterium]
RSDKIKNFYIQILVEQANQLYVGRELTKAKSYLETALRISPQDENIKRMLELVVQELAAASSAAPPPAEKPSKSIPATALSPASSVAQGSEEVSFLKSRIKEMEGLLGSLRKEQQSRIQKSDQSVFSEIIRKSEEENAKMFGWLEKKFEDMEQKQRKYSLYTLFGVMGGVAFLLLLVITFFHAHVSRKEKIILAQQEQIYALAFNRKEALRRGAAMLALKGKTASSDAITVEEMLDDPNARVRARGVEILEAELVDQDAELSERILSPFLADPDNRVRGNACKIFYRFNPSKALSVLNEMSGSNNKWMRISAAWVLGEIEAIEGIEILKKLVQDQDEHVMKRALISLCNLKESPKQSIPPLAAREVDRIINGHAKYISHYRDELRKKAKLSEVSSIRAKGTEGSSGSSVPDKEKDREKEQKTLFSGGTEGQALKDAQAALK